MWKAQKAQNVKNKAAERQNGRTTQKSPGSPILESWGYFYAVTEPSPLRGLREGCRKAAERRKSVQERRKGIWDRRIAERRRRALRGAERALEEIGQKNKAGIVSPGAWHRAANS